MIIYVILWTFLKIRQDKKSADDLEKNVLKSILVVFFQKKFKNLHFVKNWFLKMVSKIEGSLLYLALKVSSDW